VLKAVSLINGLSYLFPADASAINHMATDAGNSTFDALIHTQLNVDTGSAPGPQVGQPVVARAEADGEANGAN
jgi:hypothetical protein